MNKDTMTASRMACLLGCPRKHYYQYELNLHRKEGSLALRFGSAFHAALEARADGMPPEEALKRALDTAESFEEIDAATLTGLFYGYCKNYEGDREAVAKMCAEVSFELPIEGSRTFLSAGKIDGLAQLKDGRVALVEHKTCGEDIGDGADYWIRLRFNQQLYQYVDAARRNDWAVDAVIYDVVRKPSIRQKQNEKPEEFCERLQADTQDRPGFYFQRREVSVLEQDMEAFYAHRLALGQMILFYRAAQRNGRFGELPEAAWPRNCNGFSCKACEYAPFCLQQIHVSAEVPPEGFEVLKNPELQGENK